MRNCSNAALMVTIFMVLSACAHTAPRHMMFKDDPGSTIASVKPDNGKAAIIVARTTKFGGAIEFDTYLDKKMIGVTQWKSYFVRTDIDPGVHYVISKAETMEPVKMNIEANRVYYIQQIPRMGVWKARVSIALVTPDALMKEFDSDCKLVVFDAKDPGEELSDEDYNQAVRDYEREVKEGLHKEHEGYQGVLAK
jgi:hypothetical protein